jgi:hypothetical protein
MMLRVPGEVGGDRKQIVINTDHIKVATEGPSPNFRGTVIYVYMIDGSLWYVEDHNRDFLDRLLYINGER